MKIVVINGSYRKNGMTAGLIESFAKGVTSVAGNAEIRTINLIDLSFRYCGGCGTCSATKDGSMGPCPADDPIKGIQQEMLAADGIVFATPVYCYSPTAVMKKFMERCLPLVTTGMRGPKPRNAVQPGKRGAVILSTGAPFPFNVLLGITSHGEKILSRYCRIFGCDRIFVQKPGGMQTSEKKKNKCLAAAYKLGLAFAGR